VPPGIDADFHTPAASAPGGDPVVAIPAFAGLDWASIVSSGLDRDVRLEILMPNNASVALPNNLPSGVKVTSGDATVIRDGLQRASLAIVPVASKESGDGAASLLAAMACGVPVVASRTWGLEHLMVDDHEGVFTAPSDGAALRAAVRKLLAAPDESRALGNHARAKVVASLSNRHWAARLARVASVLCDKPSSQFYLIAAHGRVGTGGVA
jgi:glycosyltransferase involved in cell wall biosynthesis